MAQATRDTVTDSTATTATVLQMNWDSEGVAELQHDIRLDGTLPDEDTIRELYAQVGTETFQHSDTKAVLGAIWERWNRGSGVESQEFIDAETRSVSVGDIVAVDEVLFMYLSCGYERLAATTEDIREVLEE